MNEIYNTSIKLKLCKCCNIEKPISNFNSNKKNTDGLYTYCKDCSSGERITTGGYKWEYKKVG